MYIYIHLLFFLYNIFGFTRAFGAIKAGVQSELVLGNIDAKRRYIFVFLMLYGNSVISYIVGDILEK